MEEGVWGGKWIVQGPTGLYGGRIHKLPQYGGCKLWPNWVHFVPRLWAIHCCCWHGRNFLLFKVGQVYRKCMYNQNFAIHDSPSIVPAVDPAFEIGSSSPPVWVSVKIHSYLHASMPAFPFIARLFYTLSVIGLCRNTLARIKNKKAIFSFSAFILPYQIWVL